MFKLEYENLIGLMCFEEINAFHDGLFCVVGTSLIARQTIKLAIHQFETQKYIREFPNS